MIRTATDTDRPAAARAMPGKTTLIGARVPKLDAPDKATGLARYLDDIKLPRMLYGQILFANRPHARILNIDTAAATAMAAVRAGLPS